jgi:hypothetical protein
VEERRSFLIVVLYRFERVDEESELSLVFFEGLTQFKDGTFWKREVRL